MNAPPLLEARDLVVHHLRPAGGFGRKVATEVLHGVGFSLAPGERLAVVGESGSGKSTLLRALLRLVPPAAGQVLIAGQDLAIQTPAELRALRRRAQLVFQDPQASLDPAMRVAQIVGEPLVWQRGLSAAQRAQQVRALLAEVGLDETLASRRPAELSGGQAQRVAIARALIAQPEILLCDEPVSALDMSLRAQVLDLIDRQCRARRLALVFVTHDLGAARRLCERVLVLHQGRVVESGATAQVFARPAADYTRALLAARLTLDAPAKGIARS